MRCVLITFFSGMCASVFGKMYSCPFVRPCLLSRMMFFLGGGWTAFDNLDAENGVSSTL